MSLLNWDIPEQGWDPRVSTTGKNPGSHLGIRGCSETTGPVTHLQQLVIASSLVIGSSQWEQ